MVVPVVILTIASMFAAAAYLIVHGFGLPVRLGMSPYLRALGVLILLVGFALLGWVTRYRKPVDVVVSTYITMRKFACGMDPDRLASRTEPLILQGPQRYVRHPMYLAVVMLWSGWWLALDYTVLLFMALFFFLWFNLVVIRFEEKELRLLYGPEYDAYMKAVPKFFPWRRGR